MGGLCGTKEEAVDRRVGGCVVLWGGDKAKVKEAVNVQVWWGGGTEWE